MAEQFIITIGREYGSGGITIAQILSEKFNLPLYDKKMLNEIAQEKGLSLDKLKKYDEKSRNVFFSRSVGEHCNSPEDTVAQMQFDFLRQKADSGESFVVIGRCANYILRDYPGIIKIFINADMPEKIDRISKVHQIPLEKAEEIILKKNKKRKSYHNYYCKEKWGDSRYYDIVINSSKLGIEKTADMLEKYINQRLKQNFQNSSE